LTGEEWTAGDFPHLRAAARSSVIGGAVLWTLDAVRHAWADASVTRALRNRIAGARGLSAAEFTRALSIVIASAAIATWAVGTMIPVYLGTTVPEWGLWLVAAGFILAAIFPEAAAREWSRSGLRKLSLWLRAS
jgi:hypothetical protein